MYNDSHRNRARENHPTDLATNVRKSSVPVAAVRSEMTTLARTWQPAITGTDTVDTQSQETTLNHRGRKVIDGQSRAHTAITRISHISTARRGDSKISTDRLLHAGRLSASGRELLPEKV